jgi:hypothetical protein
MKSRFLYTIIFIILAIYSNIKLELNSDVLLFLTRNKFSVRTVLKLDLAEKERSSGRSDPM